MNESRELTADDFQAGLCFTVAECREKSLSLPNLFGGEPLTIEVDRAGPLRGVVFRITAVDLPFLAIEHYSGGRLCCATTIDTRHWKLCRVNDEYARAALPKPWWRKLLAWIGV